MLKCLSCSVYARACNTFSLCTCLLKIMIILIFVPLLNRRKLTCLHHQSIHLWSTVPHLSCLLSNQALLDNLHQHLVSNLLCRHKWFDTRGIYEYIRREAKFPGSLSERPYQLSLITNHFFQQFIVFVSTDLISLILNYKIVVIRSLFALYLCKGNLKGKYNPSICISSTIVMLLWPRLSLFILGTSSGATGFSNTPQLPASQASSVSRTPPVAKAPPIIPGSFTPEQPEISLINSPLTTPSRFSRRAHSSKGSI